VYYRFSTRIASARTQGAFTKTLFALFSANGCSRRYR